ncbi:uncharacterized protein LOC135433095 [Drosophila montana]|uniref:uncharacterized protein LOC135433095 n=1 Tax=Drosophila montana TaxID=40370 RepID=UPI00313C5B23
MTRKWTDKETKLLLRLYLKYKREFHERHKKRTEIWQHVVSEFEEHGYRTSYIKLDRKFRNMSRTYFNIKRQNKDVEPNWEYFGPMDEIFAGTIPETSDDMSYQEPDEEDTEPRVEVKIEELDTDYPGVLMDEPNFEELVSNRISEEQPEIDVENAGFATGLEAQRVEELRAIRITLEEANEIQRQRNTLLQERNELMKQYLATKFRYNPHLY